MKKHLLVPIVASLGLSSTASGVVIVNEVDPSSNRVEFYNSGLSSVDISSYWICSRFSYDQVSNGTLLSGSSNLAPGAYVSYTTPFVLNDPNGDFSFYSTPSFGASSAMVDFVQWGSSGNGRESVAVAKGIWSAGEFVSGPFTGSIQFDQVSAGDSSADFFQGPASFGVSNVIPEPTTGLLAGLGALALFGRRRK